MDSKEQQIKQLINNSFFRPFLDDEKITDIRFNGTYLKVKDNIRGAYKPEQQPTLEEVETFCRQVADIQGKGFTDTEAILDTQLDILRVNAIHRAGSPFGSTLSLRVSRPRKAMNHLSEVSTEDVEQLLKAFVQAGISMVISGITGTGKTEVQKMLVGFIDDNKTISLIEDTMDSHIKALYPDKDINSWRILDGEDRSKKFLGTDFIRAGLRNDSDWIIVSETRGPEEAYELVQSALTGHSMITTLHTYEAADIPSRLLNMIGEKYKINELLFGKDIISRIPIGLHMKQDVNEAGEIVRYIHEMGEFADFNEKGAVYRPIHQAKNVQVNGNDYELKRETFPISDRLKNLLIEAKLYHLVPEVFK